jgi:acyl carrier protein
VQKSTGDEVVSEADKVYESKVLKMMLNKYLDESTLITEESLSALEVNHDQVVWNLATRIYSQSGHKVELSTVRDIVNSRIGAMKYQLAAEKERIAEQARHVAEQKAQQAAEEARCVAEQKAAEAAYLRDALAECGGNELKAQIFVRIREIISEQLSVDKNGITLDSHISHNLLADECDTVELSMALEEEFDVEIPDDMLGSAKVWPPSYSSNSFGDYFAVACTVRELLLFIHEKKYAARQA